MLLLTLKNLTQIQMKTSDSYFNFTDKINKIILKEKFIIFNSLDNLGSYIYGKFFKKAEKI